METSLFFTSNAQERREGKKKTQARGEKEGGQKGGEGADRRIWEQMDATGKMEGFGGKWTAEGA